MNRKRGLHDWSLIGDTCYERQNLCSWNVHLDSCTVRSAASGGPIAVLVPEERSTVHHFRIISSTGHKLCVITYENANALLEFGWTKDELLLCIHRDGRLLQHDIHGQVVHDSYPLSRSHPGQFISRCKMRDYNVVVLTNLKNLLMVSFTTSTAQVRALVTGELPKHVQAIEVKNSSSSNSPDVEAIFACGNLVVAAGVHSHREREFPRGDPILLSTSPCAQFLAVFTATGKVIVVSMDLSKIISEFDTRSRSPPSQMAWCGADAVVLFWPEILLMIGPNGDWMKYSYENQVFLSSEVDGVRVMTSECHDIIRRVPIALVNVYSIGSTNPAATLRDAAEHHERRSPKTECLLKLIGDDVILATERCVLAACHTLCSREQSELLNAARFGMSCAQRRNIRYNPWALRKACVMLRVLNAVRHADVGIGLTYAQYCHDGLETLIARLMYRNQHFLASRISKLGKGVHKVIHGWANAKVHAAQGISDSMVSSIVSKVAHMHGSTYADAAKTFHTRGREGQFRNVLELESKSSSQVSILIGVGDYHSAMSTAIQSRDADLINITLFHLQQNLTFQDLAALLSSFPQV